MKTLKFVDEDPTPKVGILIKESSFKEAMLIKHYVQPMVDAGINRKEIVSFSLDYSMAGKAPATLIKDYIECWLQSFKDSGVKYLFCADSAYFKALTKQRKAEPNLGYVLPCAIPGFEEMHVVYSLGYGALIHNPNQQEKIDMSLEALVTHYHGSYVAIGSDIIHEERYPNSLSAIKKELAYLHQFPSLAVDIEAFSLNLRDAGLGTISFAETKHKGSAFFVEYQPIVPEDGFFATRADAPRVKQLLKQFFESYRGKLIAHNASYDFKCLIHSLWMKHPLDWDGMLRGLDVLTRCFDDTKIIAYLAKNSTAKVQYGLKALAQPFAGNWAEDDIKDIRRIPPEKILRYNLVDTLSTNYAHEIYYPMMVEEEQEELYHSLMIPSQVLIIQIECHGLPLMPARVQEVKLQLETEVSGLISIMELNAYVQEATDRLQIAAMKAKQATLKKKIVERHEFTDPINYNSGQQLAVLLYDVMDMPVIEWTDTGERATGGDVIKALRKHTEDPEKLEVMNALHAYSKLSKILSAFIPAFENAWLKADGMAYLHGSFNIGGTKSGRLSGSEPNLQQIPASGKLGKLIKSCFAAGYGHIFCGADFASLEDRISALMTKDPNKLKVYTDGYDGHCLRAYTYFKDKMPDIDPNCVESINSIEDLYPDERQDSKAPTFLLTYGGTYHGLIKNCGFSEEVAKHIETLYHILYEHSDKVIADRIQKEAVERGYVTLAFGLKLRTPLLAKTILGNRYTTYEAQQEARTAGNAMGQSYGLLNNRAAVEFMRIVWKSKHRLKIMPVALIHDAIYLVIEDDLEVIEFANKHLTKCMEWQDLPEIAHDEVKLGGDLDLFYPHWGHGITLPRDANKLTIYQTATAAMAKYEEKLKEAA